MKSPIYVTVTAMSFHMDIAVISFTAPDTKFIAMSVNIQQ